MTPALKNKNYQERLEAAVFMYLSEKEQVNSIIKKTEIKEEDLYTSLHAQKYYYAKRGARIKTVKKVKEAAEKYCTLGGFPNTNLSEVCKEFNLATKILSDYLQEFYPDIRIYGVAHFNEYIFDTIDTEEKAYWLGFIYADGFIDSSPLEENKNSNYEFELSLSLKDIEHLKKFAKFMEWENKVISDSYRCRFFVNSKHLWNVLNTYGCTPRKSLTLKFPKIETFVEKDLIRHFIRGYFDGDGCVSHVDKNQTIANFHLIGTGQFLSELKKYLPLGDKLTIRILHPEIDNITKYISTSNKAAIKIISYLYDNCSIYLQRKYDLYLKYCRSLEESNELLQGKIGEDCDVNTEINSEISQGSESL